MPLLFEDLTYQIIGCCFNVHKSLGKGFKENLYKEALVIEFNKKYIPFEKEKQYKIKYNGVLLSHFYTADFIIFEKIILEVKAAEFLSQAHIKQTLNYLAATELKVALLVNFGEKSLKYKRLIL